MGAAPEVGQGTEVAGTRAEETAARRRITAVEAAFGRIAAVVGAVEPKSAPIPTGTAEGKVDHPKHNRTAEEAVAAAEEAVAAAGAGQEGMSAAEAPRRIGRTEGAEVLNIAVEVPREVEDGMTVIDHLLGGDGGSAWFCADDRVRLHCEPPP